MGIHSDCIGRQATNEGPRAKNCCLGEARGRERRDRRREGNVVRQDFERTCLSKKGKEIWDARYSGILSIKSGVVAVLDIFSMAQVR